MHNSGSFTEAKKEPYQKGLKAYFKFLKCFEHHKPKIKTLLHVFDHTIKPVLLYGSETNIAIAGKLGRYPLFLEVILNMIKYFIHLSNPICTGLVSEAFEASRQLHLENKRSWYRNITEVIDYFGMDKCKIFNLKSTLKNYIFQCLCMKYKNTWKSEIFNDKRHNSCGNKLRTYRLFKDQFVF